LASGTILAGTAIAGVEVLADDARVAWWTGAGVRGTTWHSLTRSPVKTWPVKAGVICLAAGT